MSANHRGLLYDIYDRLLAAYGRQSWWPAETPFEVVVGAILTQNTAWRNVEQAIRILREQDLLHPEKIGALPVDELAVLIRSSGYYNQKARKLKGFCEHLAANHGGSLDDLFSLKLDSLREELLSIRGIGPETADSIVLYAAEQPSFVVDTYTHRIFSRHDWVAEELRYDELRDFFMDRLEPDIELFKEYHALIVRTGHHHCKRTPSCDGCPLQKWVPD